MLTVKHVANGCETIYEAPHGVQYYGPFGATGHGSGSSIVMPQAADAPGKILYGGNVYVMNGNGATVGTYNLGQSPRCDVGSTSKVDYVGDQVAHTQA